MAAFTFVKQDSTFMLPETGEWNEKDDLAEEYFAWQSTQRKRQSAEKCTLTPGKKFYVDHDANSSVSDMADEDSADEDSFDPLLTPTASSSLPTITKSTNSCFSVLPVTEFTIVQIPTDSKTNALSTVSHLRRCDTRCYSGLDKWFSSDSRV